MNQNYYQFIENKYEGIFTSLKRCAYLEDKKMLIDHEEFDSYPMNRVIDVMEDSRKPRSYRPKSPPSEEYIKRKYLELLHEIEVVIKLKKNLKKFGDLEKFLERKDEILLTPEECIEEINDLKNSRFSHLFSNAFDSLLGFCTPNFFSPEKQRARGKVTGPTKRTKTRNIAKEVTEKLLAEKKNIGRKQVKEEMLRLYISIDIDGLYKPNKEGMKFKGKYFGPIQEDSFDKVINNGMMDYGIKACK